MHKTFTPIDEVLLNRIFQPLSDLMTERLGIVRGTAACFCLDLASLGWIVSRTNGLSDAVMAWDAVVAMGQALILLIGLAALTALRNIFRRSAAAKHGNPLRLSMRPHRAILLLMLLARIVQPQALGLPDLADFLMLVSAISALYLGACVEPPRVRRALAALAGVGPMMG